jgi:hypothetical protein
MCVLNHRKGSAIVYEEFNICFANDMQLIF